jgi:hypothetical protein
MERIVYRKTLDVHKNGIQFTLQGFETADKMARSIEISLMASGDTIDIPSEQVVAMMYVTTPNVTEPSINECTIKGNTIIYDVIPITEEGITEMQIKLIETSVDGVKSVLASPKFAVEVLQSNTEDEKVEQTATFTALEEATARARAVYDARFIRMEIGSECIFRAYYADGTVYETDALKETMLQGKSLLAKSYAVGGTGIRDGEDTDNAMYYSKVSRSASKEADRVNDEASELLKETQLHSAYTSFSVDFSDGTVKYISPKYTFKIDEETGELVAIGEVYTLKDIVKPIVEEAMSNFVEEAVSNHNETGAGVDYIVEEGTVKTHEGTTEETIWRYRKWNSGVAECWGEAYCSQNFDANPHAPFNSTAFDYCGLWGKRDYPFAFTERPCEWVNVQSYDINTAVFPLGVGNGKNSKTQTGQYCAAVITSGGETFTKLRVYIDFFVRGMWK